MLKPTHTTFHGIVPGVPGRRVTRDARAPSPLRVDHHGRPARAVLLLWFRSDAPPFSFVVYAPEVSTSPGLGFLPFRAVLAVAGIPAVPFHVVAAN